MTAGRALRARVSRRGPAEEAAQMTGRHQTSTLRLRALSPSDSERAFLLYERDERHADRTEKRSHRGAASPQVAASPNFFFTDYRGLTVGELRTLAQSRCARARRSTRSSRTRCSARRWATRSFAAAQERCSKDRPASHSSATISSAAAKALVAVRHRVEEAADQGRHRRRRSSTTSRRSKRSRKVAVAPRALDQARRLA